MFTLFDLIRLLAIVGGAAVLGAMGWNTFGMLGCVVGVPLGFVFGAVIGQLPLIVVLKWMSRRFDRMTDEQLVDELHNPACLTPNIILLELNQRGFNIQRELPFVQSLNRRAIGDGYPPNSSCYRQVSWSWIPWRLSKGWPHEDGKGNGAFFFRDRP